jgi:hypothetical protein
MGINGKITKKRCERCDFLGGKRSFLWFLCLMMRFKITKSLKTGQKVGQKTTKWCRGWKNEKTAVKMTWNRIKNANFKPEWDKKPKRRKPKERKTCRKVYCAAAATFWAVCEKVPRWIEHFIEWACAFLVACADRKSAGLNAAAYTSDASSRFGFLMRSIVAKKRKFMVVVVP